MQSHLKQITRGDSEDLCNNLDDDPGVIPAVEAALVPDQPLHAGVPPPPGRGEAPAVTAWVPGCVLRGEECFVFCVTSSGVNITWYISSTALGHHCLISPKAEQVYSHT